MRLTKDNVRDSLGMMKMNVKLDTIEKVAKIVESEQKALYRKKIFDPNVTAAFENIKDRLREMTK